MATYSHSKISTFENCPYQYKLKYIDRIKPEIKNTIEAFMGDLVHRTLEKLYKDKKFEREVSKQELLEFYEKLWSREFSDDILIAKKWLTEENYKKMGIKFISDYYDKYFPFNQFTILGLETQDRMILPDGNQWHIRIDKFACDDEGNYYVCDYKTNSRMKDQQEADSDRQLAMYSIWVKDKFKDAKSVKLLWYMLAFNKEVVSERTDEQLQMLQENIMSKIKTIESATKFPTHITPLCNYCGYQSICPSFKHKIELKKKEDVKEMKEEDGVKIVDEFAEIKNKIKELEDKESVLKLSLIEFAKSKGIDVVYGSNMKCSVKDNKKIAMPEDKTKLISILKEKGMWEEFVMLNYSKINAQARKQDLDKEIMDELELVEDYRISLSKRKED